MDDHAERESGLQIRYIPLEAVAHIENNGRPKSDQQRERQAPNRCPCQYPWAGYGLVCCPSPGRNQRIEHIPEGHFITWGGQFENIIKAEQGLMVVVPIALSLIFMMLIATFGNARHAILVFIGVPMALSTGLGAGVQRPLAAVVIGGLISSTILTLLVLPTLYSWFGARVRPGINPPFIGEAV